MPFLTPNIDRAIVVTQYDLRGFLDPVGFRSKKGENAKGFSFIPGNMIVCAVGRGNGRRKATDDVYTNPSTCSYEQCLAMCKQFAADCDQYQKEAVQLIVKDIVEQSKERKAKWATGETEPSGFFRPLEKGNYWGNMVLALLEAFEVNLETVAA